MINLAEFHFLYPLWFLIVPLVVFIWWWLARQSTSSQAWQHFIDERLRPFVISGKEGSNSQCLRHMVLLVSMVSIIALAGPSWQKRQLPAFQTQQGLVLVLDLSLSMLATDVAPNRLSRARFKLLDLLKIRKEGQTGLVVFAGDAFAVSPLTDDIENIIEQAKNLSPQIMPIQGSQVYRGIDEAALLLQQAGYATGDILVIADGVSNLDQALQSAQASVSMGYRISVAAIGTEEGGPIPISQAAFLQDSQGQMVTAGLDVSSLQEIASNGGGLFQEFTLKDDDIEGFQSYFSQDKSTLLDDKETTVEHWHNEGVWLLWLLILPLLLLFRKGYLFSLGMCALTLNLLMPQPAVAFTWDELWLNADQLAHRALINGEPEQAKSQFQSQDWKASAAYKNGDFEESAGLFSAVEGADGHYNQGNALAKFGKLEEAIESYGKAIQLQPDHEDAKFNQELLKKMQEEKKKQEQKQQDQKQSDNKDGLDSKDKKQDQKDGKEGQESKDQESKEGQQGKDQSQAEQQSEAEKKKAEAAKQEAEEEAKKRAETEEKAEDDSEKKEGKLKPKQDEMTEEQKQQARQTQQWLHKIPDDSAGLWRRKFQYQYNQRRPVGSSSGSNQGQQSW